jgi:hypothetical protein
MEAMDVVHNTTPHPARGAGKPSGSGGITASRISA